ncbi:hypothetical protein L1049_022824 [Liquidambar formosana]|uniref:Ubiquitin fusion degradaton protein n=1 Tax=Liquidambar formosana TaxID=63359 RepID=A0AAP0WP79_LIQFO
MERISSQHNLCRPKPVMELASQESNGGSSDSSATDHTSQENSNGGLDDSSAVDHTSQASNGGCDGSSATDHTSQASDGGCDEDSTAEDHTSKAGDGGCDDDDDSSATASQASDGGCDEDDDSSARDDASEVSDGDDDSSASDDDDDSSSGDWEDSFKQIYRCYPLSQINKSHLEIGDKIIMPHSALEYLIALGVDFPMMFEVQNPSTGRVSHCGVLEFSCEEGMVFLPNWMMSNMKLHEGDDVRVKNTTLPYGTFLKLQPHTTDFIRLSDPKAVLEVTLRNFSCLTAGDTIMITHNGRNFYIDVVETKPSSAVSIIETDCEVDFAPPLDYKESEKPKPQRIVEEPTKEEPKFKPFTGAARRLDGKPVTELAARVLEEDQSIAADSTMPERL